MFSWMSVCPQLASWLIGHYSFLLRCGRYASYWNAFLLLIFFILPFILVLIREKYSNFPNKKLKNVIKSVMTSSTFHCVTWCSMMPGCFAANLIGNHIITCELTTGHSNENEMEDDSLSQLFVLGKNAIHD